MGHEEIPEDPDTPWRLREPVLVVMLPMVFASLALVVQALAQGAWLRAAISALVTVVITAAMSWARNRVTPLAHAQLSPELPLMLPEGWESRIAPDGVQSLHVPPDQILRLKEE